MSYSIELVFLIACILVGCEIVYFEFYIYRVRESTSYSFLESHFSSTLTKCFPILDGILLHLHKIFLTLNDNKSNIKTLIENFIFFQLI